VAPASLPRAHAVALGTAGADRARLRPTGAGLSSKARDWMNTTSWVVSEIVIVFFMIIINSLVG
jgi:hypothetical protein